MLVFPPRRDGTLLRSPRSGSPGPRLNVTYVSSHHESKHARASLDRRKVVTGCPGGGTESASRLAAAGWTGMPDLSVLTNRPHTQVCLFRVMEEKKKAANDVLPAAASQPASRHLARRWEPGIGLFLPSSWRLAPLPLASSPGSLAAEGCWELV